MKTADRYIQILRLHPYRTWIPRVGDWGRADEGNTNGAEFFLGGWGLQDWWGVRQRKICNVM